MLAAIVIDLNPNILALGPFTLTWHGVFSVIGIAAAARLAGWLADPMRRLGLAVRLRQAADAARPWRSAASPAGVPSAAISNVLVWMVIGGIVGARLLYVWENYQYFESRWPQVLALNEGGISQWGGIYGALVAGFLWCRRSGYAFADLLDLAGPATALGFAIGRIGDVINGEHHAIASSLPWAVTYVNAQTLGEPGRTVHPEVAYEMLWSLLLLAALLPLFDRMRVRLPAGATGIVWLCLYAAGRFSLSFLREDSLFWGLRQAQWASLLMIVLGGAAAAILFTRSSRRRPALTLTG